MASANNDKEKTPSEDDDQDPKLKKGQSCRIKGKRTYFCRIN
jgi:hypothetical protein